MGVRGLSSFFDVNPELSRPHQLHDTKVVIDGNNLVNVLYFTYKVDCTYGGDYHRFAFVIKKYFTPYLQCNISPIVIFDGAYDKTDRKLRTTIARARNRLSLAKYIAKHGSSSRVLPILALVVFKDVLNEMNITYAQCNYEADDQITAVANHYKCPVISQDSDFYIFDICGGFIRLDSVETTVQTNRNHDGEEEYNFLSCSIYHIDNFLSFFPGIEKNVLPLFSTLIGNDFVHMSTFETFFMNIKLPKVKSKRLKVNKRHQRMIGLLSWFRSHNLNDGIEVVLGCLKKEKRSVVKQLIRQTVEGYSIPISNLLNYLNDIQLSSDTYTNTLFSLKDNALPGWFAKRFQEADISPFHLNVVGLRRVFMMSQIEDHTLPSTHCCSLPIRKVLYGILLSIDGTSESSGNPVEEYDRQEGSLQRFLVEPAPSIEGFGKLPKLSEVQLNLEHGRRIVSCVLAEHDTCVKDFPKSLNLFFMCIRYWLRHCHPKPTDSFVDALLLTILFLTFANPLVPDNVKSTCTDSVDFERLPSDYGEKASISDAVERILPSNASFFSKNMKRFFQKPVHNCGRNIILPIVHSYNQLQSCIFSALLLNELLGHPFAAPKIHHVLSGTMVYNLTREIKIRPVPRLFISETVGRDSALDHLFSMLKRAVLENLPADCLREEAHLAGQKRKKKKTPRSPVTTGICTEEEHSSSSMGNQFECLSLSDTEYSTVDIFL